jgi:hypothetical protein
MRTRRPEAAREPRESTGFVVDSASTLTPCVIRVYDPPTTEDAYQEWWRDRPCEARQPTDGDVGTVPNPGRFSCEIRSSKRPFLREGSLGFSGSIEAQRSSAMETTR